MTTKNAEEFQPQVERLAREHLMAQQKVATTALERAFAWGSVPTRNRPSRAMAGRRRPAELAELVERLFEAVRAYAKSVAGKRIMVLPSAAAISFRGST